MPPKQNARSRFLSRRRVLALLLPALFCGLYIVSDGLLEQRNVDARSLHVQLLDWLSAICAFYFLACLIWAVVCLFRRKWIAALYYYLVFALLGPAADLASSSIRGNRFVFPGRSHREIAIIYERLRSEPEFASGYLQLVNIGDQCHPPSECGCWIVLDPNHISGADKEIGGGWHRPGNTFPGIDFAIVDVQRLDRDAYSVLACSIDWTLFVPV